jgi:nucleotide-binding universal stress UspA family protein
MKVLIPTDGSSYSEAAAVFLGRLGLGPGDEIYVLHVVRDYLLPDEIDGAKDFKLAGIRAAKRLVKEFGEKNFRPGPHIIPLVREGEPWQEISCCSEDLGVDLIAMGHRGLSGIKRFMLGSVTHKVVRNAAASVLVVREAPHMDRPFRVIFCTDGTPSSDNAKQFLLKLPLPPGSEVTVLSVVDMDLTSLPEVYYPEEDTSKMMAELRAHFTHIADEAMDMDVKDLSGHLARVEKRLVFGVPDDEIINVSSEMESDLVVMGCRDTAGITGVLLGSASFRVLKHITCSVLIARSGRC